MWKYRSTGYSSAIEAEVFPCRGKVEEKAMACSVDNLGQFGCQEVWPKLLPLKDLEEPLQRCLLVKLQAASAPG